MLTRTGPLQSSCSYQLGRVQLGSLASQQRVIDYTLSRFHSEHAVYCPQGRSCHIQVKLTVYVMQRTSKEWRETQLCVGNLKFVRVGRTLVHFSRTIHSSFFFKFCCRKMHRTSLPRKVLHPSNKVQRLLYPRL